MCSRRSYYNYTSCLIALLGCFQRGLWKKTGRSETQPQVTETHIKAASLENDRSEGNRITEGFNRPETAFVCAIVNLSCCCTAGNIENNSSYSVIAFNHQWILEPPQLNWKLKFDRIFKKKRVAMKMAVLGHFNFSNKNEHHWKLSSVVILETSCFFYVLFYFLGSRHLLALLLLELYVAFIGTWRTISCKVPTIFSIQKL